MLLFSINDLSGFMVQGREGSIGKIDGFLFSPLAWGLEYLTIKRGIWPFNKELYLPVEVLDIPDNLHGRIQIDLNHKEVEKLQNDIYMNIKMRKYTKHPIHYWRKGEHPNAIPWLDSIAISAVFSQRKENKPSNLDDRDNDKKLCSLDGVKGYRVNAKGTAMGNVKDFIIDADHWFIRYVIVESDDETIMLPTSWVNYINPEAESIYLNLNKQMVLESPYVLGSTYLKA